MLQDSSFRLAFFPLTLERFTRLAPWMALGLVLLLSYSLASLTWRLWPIAETGESVFLSRPLLHASPVVTPVNLDHVADLHLLGRADMPLEVPVVPVSAPETRLNLVLKGLLSASSPPDARAIIAEGNQMEEGYRVGDSLSGGATVHEIYLDRVVLSRGGRFETLSLPNERLVSASPLSVTRPAVSSDVSVGTSQQLRELRDALIQSPQDVMRLMRAQPLREDGQLRGYVVHPGQERRLFSQVGLRPGDLVTAVNGISLSDPARVGVLFQQLSSASSLAITVERRGRQTELNLNLD